jgi:hypothetical protein
MALPKLSTPTHTLKIPSTGKTVTYRPFLVKEEKLLMMAKEGGDTSQMVDTLKKLVSACVETKIDIDSLTTYDIEYIFLMLRAKSVGEEVEILVTCEHCDAKKPMTLIIGEDIKLSEDKKIDSKIPLTSEVGVILKHPTVDAISKVNTEDSMDVLVSCIESIYDSTTVHNVKDYPKQEVMDFVGALNVKELQKLQDFFDGMPKVKCDLTWVCEECGEENRLVIEGLSNFF